MGNYSEKFKSALVSARGKAAPALKKICSALKNAAVSVRRGFLNALYPENVTCDLCGAELIAGTRYNLCAACCSEMDYNNGKKCVLCGAPLRNEAEYCLRCQNNKREFYICRAPLVYEGKAKDLILSLKYSNKRYVASTLGAMMADAYVENGMSADVIVYVPMSSKEEKARGYNQAELLAYDLGERLNITVLPALVKTRETVAQKGLTAKERGENLSGAFSCVAAQVRGLNVMLVDDVFTTGATANECAKVLNKAKARGVSVLTAAVTRERILTESGSVRARRETAV